MLKKTFWISVLLVSASQGLADTTKPSVPPVTAQRPTIDTYQGIKVSDPYQWLEDTKNPEVGKWTEDQNSYAHAFLNQLPSLDKIREQLREWNNFEAPVYRAVAYRNGIYFALKLQPPKNQALLVTLTSLDDTASEKVLLDPNVIDSSGTTAIDFFKPSLNGKFVAVSLSKGGSEIGTLHIYETQTKNELPDQIPTVTKPTGGGDVAWNQDASGVYYTRYPNAGERPTVDLDFFQQVYFHKLGTSVKKDEYALGRDFPRISETKLSTSQDGHYILASVENGDGGEFAHYILGPSGKWIQITHFKDKIKQVHLGFHDELYLVSIDGSPKGKILKLTLDQPDLSKAQTLIPESKGVVEQVRSTETKLYVVYLNGGPSEIQVFSQLGKSEGLLPTVPLSDSSDLSLVTGDEILFRSLSYVTRELEHRRF